MSKSVVSCLLVSDTTCSSVLSNAFEKHPDSVIAYGILCSSSQLRHESFLLREKGFPFCVRFSSLSRNCRCKNILNTPDYPTSAGDLLEQWTVVTRHPIRTGSSPLRHFSSFRLRVRTPSHCLSAYIMQVYYVII